MSGALIVSMAEASCHHELMLMGRHLVWCKGILGCLTHLHRFLFFFFFFSEEVQKEEWAAVAKSHGGLCLNSPERRHYWTASGKATLRKAAVRTPRVRSWTLTQTAISKEERRRLRLQGRNQWWSLKPKAGPRGSVWGAWQAGLGVRAVVSCPQGLLSHWPPLLSAFSQAAVSQPSSLKGRQDDTADLGWCSCLVGASICHSSQGRILIGPPSSCH